jgi:polyhydroxybutyrate depolymerase
MKNIIIAIAIIIAILITLNVVTKRRQENSAQEKSVTHSSLGSGNHTFSLMQGGRKRIYKLYIPSSYSQSTKIPVVIFLHGGGGSTEAAELNGMNEKSDKFGFILLAPGGTGTSQDKLLTWNSGKWEGGDCCGYAYKNNIDDVGFISQLIDDVKKKVNIDEKRIYATGISNGALMSYRLACELSDRIAAVAAVASPAVPGACQPKRPISVIQINGAADPLVPINGGNGGSSALGTTFIAQSAKDMVAWWVKNNKCQNNPAISYKKGSAVCQSYAGGIADAEVEFCRVEDMGHVWPSGNQYLPSNMVGAVSQDISFDQIWEFFKKHLLE